MMVPRNSETGSGHEPAPGTGCSLRTFVVISVGGTAAEGILQISCSVGAGLFLAPLFSAELLLLPFSQKGKGSACPRCTAS